jgi:excisionase family DNA binding protein
MYLSLQQAADRLGKSPRQVRYLIRTGRLSAQKIGGRWVVSSDDLPLSEGQRAAVERRERQLRVTVEDGLGLSDAPERPPRYSVRDLKAFQVALPLYRRAVAALAPDHPAAVALREVLELLTRGCHRFERSAKAEAYRQARDAASRAVCELLLDGSGPTDELVSAIEQDLMASLAGLLKRLERRRVWVWDRARCPPIAWPFLSVC